MTDVPRDKDYLEKLIELLESDKKAVMLCIGLELAVPLLSIKDLTIGQTVLTTDDPALLFDKFVLVAALILFLAAAYLHFLYFRRVHLNAFAVARLLLSGTGEDARALIFDDKDGIWARHGWKYTGGNCCLSAAIALYLVFMAASIF